MAPRMPCSRDALQERWLEAENSRESLKEEVGLELDLKKRIVLAERKQELPEQRDHRSRCMG